VNNALNARLLAAVALMAALTAVGAWLRIPVPYVPFTLQMSFVYLSGVWLGARYGALAQLVYISAGLMGFPIFAKGGGPHYVLEPSFGYIIGFLPAAYAAGILTRQTDAYARYFVAAAAALIMVYLPGVVWLHAVFHYVLGRETALTETLVLGLSPLPKDLVLIPLNAYLGKQIKSRIPFPSNGHSEHIA